MTEDLEKQLFDKYEPLFKGRHEPHTCMDGIDCSDGWYHLLDALCGRLVEIREKYDATCVFDQIKEKFGTLRTYHHVEFGPRWAEDHTLLDGKSGIEKETLGWTGAGTMPAHEGIVHLIDEALYVADMESHIICERCGTSGATRTKTGWVTTLCNECRKEKKRKEQETSK
jgi:hypothetical protein